jgi:WD40 repeat protein
MQGLARSPEGDRLLVGTGRSGVRLLSVGDELPQTLPGSSGQYFSVAFSPDGRFAAAVGGQWEAALRNIGVWDVASMEQVAVFAQGELVTQYANVQFVGNGHIMAVDRTGLRRWNIESGASDLLHEGSFIRYAATPEGRRALLVEAPTSDGETQVVFLDLETGDATSLETHGNRISTVALDDSGEIAASGGPDGSIRVGPVTGEEPHLLLGHESGVAALAIDPLGRWVAAGDGEGVIRLWPMPDLSKPPLHTLPREELIAKLKTLTNLRVVRDEESSTGWKLTHDPFPGWETVPTW